MTGDVTPQMTPEEHEAAEELLAGYALGSLSGTDAAAVDHLLLEHVPACARCRQTLDAFTVVSADLGLVPAPVEPPDTLLPALRRELEPPHRRRTAGLVAVAASVVAVVGLAGLGIQGTRMSNQRARNSTIAAALDVARQPDANLVSVGPASEISKPGSDTIYIYGRSVPQPHPGNVYRVYLVADGQPTYAGEFVPEGGEVILEIRFPADTFDDIWITEELEGTQVQPSAGEALWRAAA